MIKRRSLVFVVSDFISEPGWESALARLARRHEVVAVRLYDPLEMDLPDLGLVMMQDAETGEQLLVDTADPGFRKRFAAAAERARGGTARRRWPVPASTRWSCPPTTTWSTRCCASPTHGAAQPQRGRCEVAVAHGRRHVRRRRPRPAWRRQRRMGHRA